MLPALTNPTEGMIEHGSFNNILAVSYQTATARASQGVFDNTEPNSTSTPPPGRQRAKGWRCWMEVGGCSV